MIAFCGGIGATTADEITGTSDDVPDFRRYGYDGPAAAVQLNRPSDTSLILALSSVPTNSNVMPPVGDDGTADMIFSDPDLLATDVLPLSGIFLGR